MRNYVIVIDSMSGAQGYFCPPEKKMETWKRKDEEDTIIRGWNLIKPTKLIEMKN